MEGVDDNTPRLETLSTADQDVLKQRLAEELVNTLRLDKKSPEFTQTILNLMAQLEKARETLGPFCSTIGEGENRAVVFTNPRDAEVVSSLILDIEPEFDYGPIRTTYRERLLVNKAGVFSISTVKDQKLDYDPYQKSPTRTRSGVAGRTRVSDPSSIEKWSQRQSTLARHYGTDSEEALASVLASGKYPEVTLKPPIPGSGQRWTPEQHAEYHKQQEAYDLGQELSPNILLPLAFPRLTDAESEVRPLRGWYTGSFKIVEVTKPETVQVALQDIPLPLSRLAPQE